jgi:hypothetical protein
MKKHVDNNEKSRLVAKRIHNLDSRKKLYTHSKKRA